MMLAYNCLILALRQCPYHVKRTNRDIDEVKANLLNLPLCCQNKQPSLSKPRSSDPSSQHLKLHILLDSTFFLPLHAKAK